MSASNAPSGRESNKGGKGEVRGNPLFANTGDSSDKEKRKIRPPASDPTAPAEPETQSGVVETRTPASQEAPALNVTRRPPPTREMGETRFDEFYVKKTMHFIPVLLDQFDVLAKKQHKSKTRLFNEAIAGILESYGVLDEETRATLKDFGIEV